MTWKAFPWETPLEVGEKPEKAVKLGSVLFHEGMWTPEQDCSREQ
jgi:hypothetical protein